MDVTALRHNGSLHQDSKEKVEILNNPFKSVFTKEDSNREMCNIKEQKYPDISDLNINVEGVAKLLKITNEHKASGPDCIPNYILKNFANERAPAITGIFKLSVSTGTLPNDLRNANIFPIFKKGSKHTASGYRPVSLTSVCCKTLEHIICRHIL
jgi:hypothetical protein